MMQFLTLGEGENIMPGLYNDIGLCGMSIVCLFKFFLLVEV